MRNLKESTSYKKTIDSIVEVEVAMQRLRQELEDGYRNDDTFKEIFQVKKSLDKLVSYVVKLPLKEQG